MALDILILACYSHEQQEIHTKILAIGPHPSQARASKNSFLLAIPVCYGPGKTGDFNIAFF